jgi:two-component system phosphate regulon sensor histidine kinase PhoR
MNNGKKIFIILFCIVLLPALFYSVYEISSLDETEEMIGQMYNRQLDAVLFSVNQYVLDVASSWATQIENGLPNDRFARLLQSNPSIISVVVSDTALKSWRSFPVRRPEYLQKLHTHRETIGRLLRYQSVAYRKLEPVIDSDSTFIILFAPSSSPSQFVGIVVNNERFISDVIGRKLTDLAQNDFILAVGRISTPAMVFSTQQLTGGLFSQQRPLWIFPDHAVKIRLRGTTIEEAANDRYYRNLILLVILDLVLLAGAFFVYRLIKREMELVALKSDFISNVSHELRTPLSLIRMFAETLEMKRVKTEKKKQEYYGIILHETERLTRLINNILNFSRMEANTRRYNFKLSNINEIIASVLTVYSYQFEKLKFSLDVSLDKELPDVSVDEEAIAEALHNLVDNAVKYSAENKYLRLASSRAGDMVLIEIEDHGIGIAAEHHSKIFEKFFRVSRGLVHTAKGSGLGLAIVQHIVQSHGGTITINSGIGKGSRFTIALPLARTE